MEEGKVFLKFYEEDPGLIVDEFSDEEGEKLNKVVTNTNGGVFAWKVGDDLSPEQSGALLSRYSRTSLTTRRLFLREFLPNKDRGKEFFESWLVDYGDDSIQEMAGGLPLSCEFVSNVAVKEIEDNRFASYIEKSSRYVSFDKKLPNGEYQFYKDPDILNSRFGEEYLELMRGLFGSYSRYIPQMVDYLKELNRFEDQAFKIGDNVVKPPELNSAIQERYGIGDEELRKSYDNAVKANALDFVRDYLPMATLTHVGVNANARSYENLILKLHSSPLAECRWIGKQMYTELYKVAPSLIGRVYEKHGQEHASMLSNRTREAMNTVREILKDVQLEKGEHVNLLEYTGRESDDPDQKAQTLISAAILFRFGEGHSFGQCLKEAERIGAEGRRELIRKYVGSRTNRRHKPGRAFENIEYLLGLVCRIGVYRDLQRHRIGTQERQRFTVKLGFDTRREFSDIGIDDDYKSKMAQVIDLFSKLEEKFPYQAQYVVTYGFYAGWYYRLNARQLFHFCELRTTPGGHPDYRRLVQDVYYKVREVHPSVTEYMSFVNLKDKELGRLESEIRIAQKRRALGLANASAKQ